MNRELVLSALVLISAPLAAQVVVEPAEKVLQGNKKEVVSLAVSPKGDRILAGTADGAVLIDMDKGRKVHVFPYSEDGRSEVYHCAFNENGEYVLLIGSTGKRQVWDTKTGEQERVLADHRWIPTPGQVRSMGLVPSNSAVDRHYQQTEARRSGTLARSGEQGAVEFVDANGAVVQTLVDAENKDRHHKAPCLFTDTHFITGTDDGRILLYTLP